MKRRIGESMSEIQVDVFQGYGLDCNIYLVEKQVIIDAGTGHNRNVFMDWLAEQTNIDDVHTLILTHRHYDHSGGAPEILDLTGVEAFIHEYDGPAVMNGDVVTTGARAFQGDQIPIKVTQIKGDHEFDINGHVFKVIYTPGHTIGSISLFNEDSGILFSGDTIFANGGIGRWDLATGNHSDLKKSIESLTKLEIKDLYPGHDVVVKGKGKQHALLSLESISEPPYDLIMRRLNLLKNDQPR